MTPDGAAGPALRCGNFQRLAWSAPGHICAQRGTLAFFWRAREPVGPPLPRPTKIVILNAAKNPGVGTAKAAMDSSLRC